MHIFASRPTLGLVMGLGCLVAWLLPGEVHGRARILVGWNVAQWLYVARMAWMMWGEGAEAIRERARRYEESAGLMLVMISLASVVVMGVVFFEVASGKSVSGLHQAVRVLLPMVTLVGAWLLVALLFAVNYAHHWYCEGGRLLRFPDEDLAEPTYGDFLYFSVTIAVASQTADVEVTSSEGRRLVLCQSVLSFFFNTSALGLTINLAASLLS